MKFVLSSSSNIRACARFRRFTGAAAEPLSTRLFGRVVEDALGAGGERDFVQRGLHAAQSAEGPPRRNCSKSPAPET
jgi:hypothetical protein